MQIGMLKLICTRYNFLLLVIPILSFSKPTCKKRKKSSQPISQGLSSEKLNMCILEFESGCHDSKMFLLHVFTNYDKHFGQKSNKSKQQPILPGKKTGKTISVSNVMSISDAVVWNLS